MSSTEPSGEPSASEPQSFIDRLRSLLGTFRPHASLRTDLVEVLEGNGEAQAGEASEFSPSERQMLRNILHLKEVGIGDIMVPRAEIVAVQKDVTLAKLLATFATASHSRLVVYDDTLDDPVGMVHIRDLMALISGFRNGQTVHAAGEDIDLSAVDLTRSLSDAGLVRRLLYVPPSMPAADLLVSMQAARIHLALVIDEYGGTDGLVSMEDVVEEIVGEIEDEHDDEEALIKAQADGSFLIDARTPLEDVTEAIGPDFAPPEVVEEVDTLGGLVITLAARVPQPGEVIATPSAYRIEVVEADPRRVKLLRIHPPAAAAEAGGTA